jgi:molybdopterin converting factor small subunit
MSMVHIPSPLLSYTGGVNRVEADGETLQALLQGLDARFPGLRFRVVDEQGRIREHIRFFVDGDLVRELSQPLRAGQEVHILCALSGG